MIGLPFLVVVVASVFLTVTGMKVSAEKLEGEEKKHRFFYTSYLPILRISPPQLSYEREIETALNRACQLGQSWILRCQECYIQTGNIFLCALPTVSFCRSALGYSINDWDLLWGFLPASSGSLLDIWTAPARDPSTMTHVSQIPEGIRWILRNTFPSADWRRFRYDRPSGGTGFPCGVSGVVTR